MRCSSLKRDVLAVDGMATIVASNESTVIFFRNRFITVNWTAYLCHWSKKNADLRSAGAGRRRSAVGGLVSTHRTRIGHRAPVSVPIYRSHAEKVVVLRHALHRKRRDLSD